jgi:hypothetical protein
VAIDKELIAGVEGSATLRRVREELLNEISFRAPGSTQFDPMLILMAISIIVQVIIACRKRNSDEKIIDWLQNARTLPRLRTIRLRRKLDALWQDYCEEQNCDKNVLFDALLDVSENASDAEIAEILQMAAQEGAE